VTHTVTNRVTFPPAVKVWISHSGARWVGCFGCAFLWFPSAEMQLARVAHRKPAHFG